MGQTIMMMILITLIPTPHLLPLLIPPPPPPLHLLPPHPHPHLLLLPPPLLPRPQVLFFRDMIVS